MKPLFLSRLLSILESQQGAAIYGKNGVVFPKVKNELGFAPSESSLPYPYFNGKIETDTNPIIFTSNGTNSAIGFYNVEEDTYVPIINDSTLNYKLGFKRDSFIQGEARRNYLNEIEITWLDTNNPPRFLNTSRPVPSALYLLDLFMYANKPKLDISIIDGGSLKKGAYYIGIKLISIDDAETNYYTLQGPVFAYSVTTDTIKNGLSGKSLKVDISGMDTNYVKFRLVVVSNINGVTTASETDDFSMTESGEYTYVLSSSNILNPITLEEALIPEAYYSQAKAITQENDILYLGNTEEPEEVKLQRYFMDARVKWFSTLVDINDSRLKSGKLKTLKHGEVYALYGVIRWKNGRKSPAFHIPGPDEDLTKITKVMTDGTEVKYKASLQNEQSYGLSATEGYTSGWKNENERYPNSDDFGTLKGTQVRHHKFPSLRVAALYNSYNPNFGVEKHETLGVKIENLNLPPDVQSKVDGIEIYFAEREYGSSLIYSQGIMMPATLAYNSYDTNVSDQVEGLEILIDRYIQGYTTNKNGVRQYPVKPYFNGTNLFYNTQRDSYTYRKLISPFRLINSFHSPETIGDKVVFPSNPMFIINGQYRSKFDPVFGSGSELRTSGTVRVMDSTNAETTTLETAVTTKVVVSDKGRYLINGQDSSDVSNLKSESKFITFNISDQVYYDYSSNLVAEHVLSVDMINGQATDLYPSFASRKLVYMGTLDSNNKCNGGDTYISVFAYTTMGVGEYELLEYQENNGAIGKESNNQFFRRVIIESATNLNMRYSDPATPDDKFLGGLISTNTNKRVFKDDAEPNHLSIPLGSNAISNVLDGVSPYDSGDKNVSKNPFKIIRSQRQARENKYNSWRKFLPLDYYETVKDKGPIINLQGFDGNLLIHHKNAIYQTVSKTTLNGDILSVTLGTGDIFQLEPKEARSSVTGIGGLQHASHATMTDIGYTFIDVDKGVAYIVNSKGLAPLNNELDNLFKEVIKDIDGVSYNSSKGIAIGYDEECYRLLFTLLNGDKSLTFSMSVDTLKWSYSHDYFPNAYITTRNKLLNVKDGKIFRFNEGNHGVFHTTDINPYYVDVVFVNPQSFVLNGVNWRTIVEDTENTIEYLEEHVDKTFTSVTIWNGKQCSGKINLVNNNDLVLENNSFNADYRWHFNKFKDVINSPGKFLESIFKDFKVIDSKIKHNQPWYNKNLFIGDYVIVRFEFDNSENKQITVIDLDINVTPSAR